MHLPGKVFALLSPLFLALLAPLPATAAESPEIVCIQCHSAMPGRLGEPVKLWKGSIHAENGIACNACHGGDPKNAANAMSPARGFLGAPKETAIPAFCGRCHVGVMRDYLASAHGKALGKGGPTCVTCHSNHHVVKASLDLINEKNCSRCHGFERARLIRDAMQETEGMIVAIDTRIAAYKEEGTDTEGMQKGLFAVRNRFHTLFHNVDAAMVKKESAGIQGDLRKIQNQLTALDASRQKRKLAGAGGISAMLLLALFAHLLRKTYD
ncbi:MAG: cytochrome c3 family protein [Oryzomonas sp.]|uniref:cytochrome c3 family protein n=1 Tax=Oryzomonas sp. TaxID=2855186 RepID=UPI0028489B59|nr:cytochrome c3 family protein [Oryzomonas sp.]MDR3578481.1 cytochrome c3 family protein [Oryzomonas sp.]